MGMYDIKVNFNTDVLESVRQNLGHEHDDTTHDNEIKLMPRHEVFNRYLTWKGIIGYSSTIRNAIESIYDVNLV